MAGRVGGDTAFPRHPGLRASPGSRQALPLSRALQELKSCRNFPAGRRNNRLPARIVTDKGIWDAFIDESPSGLLFHKWDFLAITEQHTGYRVLPYGIYKGEELVAVCPLFCRQANGLSVVLSPPPMQAVIPYLGAVMGRDYATAKQSKKESMLEVVADGLGEAIGDLAPNYLSITFVPDFCDMRRFIWDGYRTRISYLYTIDLAPSLEALWGDLNAKLRTSLRRFEKEGYYLEEGSDLTRFYETVCRRFGRPEMKIPMVTRDYFEDIFRAYPDNLAAYYLYDRDGALTGAVAAQEYKRFLLWVGTPRIESVHAENEYLQWVLLRRAQDEGYRLFENVGANTPDLNFFKSRFCSGLGIYMEICRKDTVGALAEWAYSSIASRPWLKRRVVSYVD